MLLHQALLTSGGTRRVIPFSISSGPILRALVPLTTSIMWKRNSVAAQREGRLAWRDFPSRKSSPSFCRKRFFRKSKTAPHLRGRLFLPALRTEHFLFCAEANPGNKNRIILGEFLSFFEHKIIFLHLSAEGVA